MGNSEKYGKILFTLCAQNCQESRYCVETSLLRYFTVENHPKLTLVLLIFL